MKNTILVFFAWEPFRVFLFQAYLCPWRGSRLQIDRSSSWRAWAASWSRGGGTPSGCPSLAWWSGAPPAAAIRARIWISSWSRRSSHGGAASTHSKLTKWAGRRRPSIRPPTSWTTCTKCTSFLTCVPRSTVCNINVLFNGTVPNFFYFEPVFFLCVHARMIQIMIMLPETSTKSLNAKL